MSWETPYGPPLVRRRRKIRGPVTLVVLVTFLTGVAWYGWEKVLNVSQPVERQICATPSPGEKTRISAEAVVVNVYNAGDIGGLAEDTAEDLERRGFRIGRIANDPKQGKVNKVEIRGRAAAAPEVILVAAQVAGEPEPKADSRKNSAVDLVIGNRFEGLQDKAPSAMSVETDVPRCETRTVTPNPE
jgi:LytR cell envelope-related transcriptional attenuator